MEIIAKTEKGCLIHATDIEVQAILKAVSGILPEKLNIGQKIPAIDYASTIIKVKALKDNYIYTLMIDKINSFNKEVTILTETVLKASEIEI